MKFKSESAYDMAGATFEYQRSQGVPRAEAMAYALKAFRSNLVQRRGYVPPFATRIAEQVAAENDVTLEALRAPNNTRAMVRIRDEVVWRMRGEKLSFPLIGAVLHRDSSSCVVAAQRYRARLVAMELRAA